MVLCSSTVAVGRLLADLVRGKRGATLAQDSPGRLPTAAGHGISKGATVAKRAVSLAGLPVRN